MELLQKIPQPIDQKTKTHTNMRPRRIPFLAIAASLATYCSSFEVLEAMPRSIELKPGQKTTLLFTPGENGDAEVTIHLIRGDAEAEISFGKAKAANTIELGQGNTVKIKAHAVKLMATAAEEVIGYYEISLPTVKPGEGSNPPKKAEPKKPTPTKPKPDEGNSAGKDAASGS